jgi:hypothetical protein
MAGDIGVTLEYFKGEKELIMIISNRPGEFQKEKVVSEESLHC